MFDGHKKTCNSPTQSMEDQFENLNATTNEGIINQVDNLY